MSDLDFASFKAGSKKSKDTIDSKPTKRTGARKKDNAKLSEKSSGQAIPNRTYTTTNEESPGQIPLRMYTTTNEESPAQTIPSRTYNTTTTDDVNDVASELAIVYIQQLRAAEKTNIETLRKLRELNEKAAKSKVIVQTVLKTTQKANKQLKKENDDVERQVRDAVNELKDLQGQNANADRGPLTNKIFTVRGKLKRDNALAQAMKEMLNYLEKTADGDQQYVSDKEAECDQLQNQLDSRVKDYDDKIEQRKQLKNEADHLKKLLKQLENDVRDWLQEFNSQTKHKPEKVGADVLVSFDAAMTRIIELVDACKADDKTLIELRDRLKDSRNRMSEINDSYQQNKEFMKRIESMPQTYYGKICESLENREHVLLPPHPNGMDDSEYLKELYTWGDNERNEFAKKLKQMMAAIDDLESKCANNEQQRQKEMSDVDKKLDRLEKEESFLTNKNDKLQADIDEQNAREIVNAKKKVQSLEKILQETAIFVETRQKALQENQKEIEETIEIEEMEARENEMALETLRRKKIRLEDDVERLDKEIGHMEKQMESQKEISNEEHQTMVADLKRLNEKETDLDKQISASKFMIKDTERYEAELEEINQRCDEKEREMEDKEQKLRKKLEGNVRAREELKKVEKECQNVQIQLRELEKSNKLKENRIAREKKTLQEIKCDLEYEETKSSMASAGSGH